MTVREYLAHGWKLCAIPPGQKGPMGTGAKGWNLPDAQFTPRVGWGVGLCHAYSGTCAIDIDNIDAARDWLKARGVDLDALLSDPYAVRISSGRLDRAKLVYRLAKPLPSVKTAPFDAISPKTGQPIILTALDFRCATKDGLTLQDVLPPSIHPITQRAYEWAYNDEFLADWRSLPELPPELLAIWTSEVGDQDSQPSHEAPAAPKGAHTDEIRKVLEKFDPDVVYTEWIRIGAALHYETKGSADGLYLWNEWSAKGSKYEGAADLEPHWRSFKHDATNPVTLGGLLRDTIANVDEFAIVPEGTKGEDLRPDSVVRKLLEARLVHVIGQDKYYDRESDSWLSDRGVKHTFCPHMPSVIQAGKNGKPDKVVRPDPVKFMMESETKQVVSAVIVRPGAPEFFDLDGKRYCNRYKAEPVELLRPKVYEREAFEFLWSRIKDKDLAAWLLKFFAHAVQKPGVKITSAPLLFSETQGSGKNTIMRTLPERLFGSRWVNSMSDDVLASTFSDMLVDTWWLYMEELRSGVTKGERIRATNKMKAWISDDYIVVHPKGLKPFNMPNFLQVTATSNFEDALQLDNNDRRWAVGELGGPLSERESLDLYAFLNHERASGVLRYIFQSVSLIGFNPKARPPLTKAKRTMVRAGVGSWESLLVERMVAGESPFDRDLFTQQMLQDNVIFRGTPPTPIGLGRILAKHPFNCEPLKGPGDVRYLCWRNLNEWKKFSAQHRANYVQSGVRPKLGTWSDAIPTNIREMSAYGDLDPAADDPVESIPESVAEFF